MSECIWAAKWITTLGARLQKAFLWFLPYNSFWHMLKCCNDPMTAPQATNGSQGLNIEDFKVSLNNTELNKVIQTEELFLLHKMSKRLACLNQERLKKIYNTMLPDFHECTECLMILFWPTPKQKCILQPDVMNSNQWLSHGFHHVFQNLGTIPLRKTLLLRFPCSYRPPCASSCHSRSGYMLSSDPSLFIFSDHLGGVSLSILLLMRFWIGCPNQACNKLYSVHNSSKSLVSSQ